MVSINYDLNKKLAAKRNIGLEGDALEWIYGILGEPVPDDSLEELLKDGIVLCKFVKKVFPDSPIKYSETKSQFKLMENVSNFNSELRRLGIKDTDTFQTTDLWEKKNIPQVIGTISVLGVLVQKLRPDLPAFGPKIGEEA